MQRAIVLFALLAIASGCTRVEVHKHPDAYDKGVRYYRPKPYLFISPGKVGGGDALFTVTQGAALKVKQADDQKAADATQQTDIARVGFDQPAEEVAAINEDLTPAQQDEVKGLAREVLRKEGCPNNCCPPGAVCTQRPQAISMALQYLPDFSEEYSIQLKPGLGIGTLSVKLDNGWNLTSVNMETDQQTDEIIKSTADLIGSIGGLAGGPKEVGAMYNAPKLAGCEPAGNNIYATNVPFGYYEAVIATDPCGRKQLYGWRYVGFMPFQACPVQTGGMNRTCCNETDVYGLVWVNGILQFERIGVIPTEPQLETVEPKKESNPAQAATSPEKDKLVSLFSRN